MGQLGECSFGYKLTSSWLELSSIGARQGIKSTVAFMVEPPCPLLVVATENCSTLDLAPLVHSSWPLRRKMI